MSVEATAVVLVNAIVDDLIDRRGLGQAWDGLSYDSKREIVACWTALAIQCFKSDSAEDR